MSITPNPNFIIIRKREVVLDNSNNITPPSITYRNLTVGELHNFYSLLPDQTEAATYLFNTAIVSTSDIDIDSDYFEFLSDIYSKEELQEFSTEILNYSVVSTDIYEKAEIALNVWVDDRYDMHHPDSEWNCDHCYKSGLYKERNCPLYVPEEEHFPFLGMSINGTQYEVCAIGLVDTELLTHLVEAYSYRTQQLPPMAGGAADQTQFYIKMSSLAHNKVEKYQADKIKSKG